MQTLHKSLSFWGGLGLAFSLVVGTGLLGLPGITIQEFGLENASVSWVATILAMAPLIALFVRLGSRFQSAGGISFYAEQALGPWGSYAVAMLVLGCIVIGLPAGCIISGSYLQHFLGYREHYEHESGLLILWLVTLINLMGVRFSAVINLLSMAVLVGLLVVLMGLNLPFIAEGARFTGRIIQTGSGIQFPTVWQGSLVIFWAFIGWEELSFGLEDFKNPEKNVPRVYWVSFILISVLYLLLSFLAAGATIAGVSVLGPGGLTRLAETTPVGAWLIVAMILVLIANQSANFFAFSRLIFSGGRDKKLPAFLGRLSPKGIPVASILVSSAVYTVVIIVADVFDLALTDIVTLVARNYLTAYVFALVAYWKTEQGPMRYPLSFCGLLSAVYFFSGVTWTLCYPLILMALGYAQFRIQEPKGRLNSKVI